MTANQTRTDMASLPRLSDADRLIAFIRQHGADASRIDSKSLLVTCDAVLTKVPGAPYTRISETIPAKWGAVCRWLGY